MILTCDIQNFLVPSKIEGARDQKEEDSMTKYELALVVNAKIEDEERAAVVEKAKNYITRYN